MDPVEIFIYDVVVQGQAALVIQQLKAAGSAPVKVRINSPGGDVFEGYAIYNALLAHAPGVAVQIDGLAASIASYIAMAGKPIVMAANAMFFLHNPNQEVHGNADDMRRASDLLEKIGTSLVDAYVTRTSLPREKVVTMLADETWLTPDMAKTLGFIDEVSAPLKIAAHFDMTKFPKAPKSLTDKLMNQFKTIITMLVAALPGQVTLTETSTPEDVENGVKTLTASRDLFKTQVSNLTKSIVIALKAALPNLTLSETSDPAAVESGVKALVADRDSFKTQVSDFTKSVIASLKASIPNLALTDASSPADINAGIMLLVADRDKAKTDLVTASADVTRLESVCGLAGIDPKKALPAAGEPEKKVSMADCALKLAAAKTPQARATICAEYEKAVQENRVAA